jgi:hypothetical protein
MANPNPYQARLARALKRPAGDIEEVHRRAWALLCLAYDEVGTADDAEARRKAMLAFVQLSTVYLRIHEQCEILPRLAALEAAATERNGHYP